MIIKVYACAFAQFKGIVSVISRDPPCKDGDGGFTTLPLNPCPIKNVEDIVILSQRVFILINLSITSYNQETRRETTNENEQFKEKNMDI